MKKNEILNSPVVFQVPLNKATCLRTLFFLEVDQQGLQLELNPTSKVIDLPPHWNGLLLLDKSGFEVKSGKALCYTVNPLIFSKLLVFADASRDNELEADQNPIMEIIPMDSPDILRDRRSAEYWFINIIINNVKSFTSLASLLRRTEHYWLVHFLFKKSASGDNLHKIGQHYGVSDSHFRRMSKQALGHSTKTELRLWRVARAVLDMTDRENNFTQIAIKHGYASSSHFSNDVKELLGISPRSLSDILNLAKK